jgi:hypothetical protein
VNSPTHRHVGPLHLHQTPIGGPATTCFCERRACGSFWSFPVLWNLPVSSPSTLHSLPLSPPLVSPVCAAPARLLLDPPPPAPLCHDWPSAHHFLTHATSSLVEQRWGSSARMASRHALTHLEPIHHPLSVVDAMTVSPPPFPFASLRSCSFGFLFEVISGHIIVCVVFVRQRDWKKWPPLS